MHLAILTSLALALVRSAQAQTTTPTTAPPTVTHESLGVLPTFQPGLPSFEIDIVFPRPNTTYNYTSYIPIIFAFQNLTTAASLGNFSFWWGIMPYHDPSDWRPGGVYEDDMQQFQFRPENVGDFDTEDGSPYYFVNATNTTNWQWPLEVDGPSLFSLQWYVHWRAFNGNDTCRDVLDIGNIRGNIFFELQQELPWFDEEGAFEDPRELGNVEGECAYFASMREVDVDEEGLCEKARAVERRENCKVRPDAEMVRSMSSVAAERAKPTETEALSTPEPSPTGAGNVVTIPVQSMLVLVGVVGGLGLLK